MPHMKHGSEINPLDDFSTSRIMRRCGQLVIPFEEVLVSPYFQVRPEKQPRSKVQYRDGVQGTVGWGTHKQPIAEKDTLSFTRKQMLAYLGLE